LLLREFLDYLVLLGVKNAVGKTNKTTSPSVQPDSPDSTLAARIQLTPPTAVTGKKRKRGHEARHRNQSNRHDSELSNPANTEESWESSPASK
jgi:hypothetical protein